MKTKIINIRKIVFAVTLCCGAAFAQGANGADWSQGFEGQSAQPVQPAGQTAAEQTAARIAAMTAAAQQADGQAAPVAAPDGQSADIAASEEQAAGVAPSRPEIIDAESNMRTGHDLSAQALAAAPFLRARGSAKIGEGKIRRPKDRIVYQRFDRVTVAPSGGEFSVKTGDSVDVFSAGRWMLTGGRSSQVVSRVGRGVVVGFAGKRAVVQLTEVWGAISGGESIAKRTDFEPFFCDRLELIDPRVGARVVMRVENSFFPFPQQYLIIDKGAGDGVKLGDFFRVTERRRNNHLSENVLEAQVVNVAAGTATLLVKKQYKDNVEKGDDAFSSYRTVARR